MEGFGQRVVVVVDEGVQRVDQRHAVVVRQQRWPVEVLASMVVGPLLVKGLVLSRGHAVAFSTLCQHLALGPYLHAGSHRSVQSACHTCDARMHGWSVNEAMARLCIACHSPVCWLW